MAKVSGRVLATALAGVAFGLTLAGGVLVAVPVLIAGALVVARVVRPPAAPLEGEVVPGSLWVQSAVAVLAMVGAGLAMRFDDRVVALVLIVVAVSYVWLVRPVVRLTPDGVVVAGLGRRQAVAWEEVLASGAPAPGRYARYLVLRTSGRALCVPLVYLRVQPAVLAGEVRRRAARAQEHNGVRGL